MMRHSLFIAWVLFVVSALSAASAAAELYDAYNPAVVHDSGRVLSAVFLAVISFAGGLAALGRHFVKKLRDEAPKLKK